MLYIMLFIQNMQNINYLFKSDDLQKMIFRNSQWTLLDQYSIHRGNKLSDTDKPVYNVYTDSNSHIENHRMYFKCVSAKKVKQVLA